MKDKYNLYWRHNGTPGIVWHIRGILPDARFYGEIRRDITPETRKSELVEGVIPPDDWKRCSEILEDFATNPQECNHERPFALLGKWGESLADADFLFEYEPGDEARSPKACQFLELKEILEKQVSKHYEGIT